VYNLAAKIHICIQHRDTCIQHRDTCIQHRYTYVYNLAQHTHMYTT
jgi:hypothetical protein